MRFLLYILALVGFLTHAAVAQTPATPMGPSEQAANLMLVQSLDREKGMTAQAFTLKAQVEALTKELADLKAKMPSETPAEAPK